MPRSVLTGEVVEAVAVHQLPVPVTAVGVVSHDTHLAGFPIFFVVHFILSYTSTLYVFILNL